MVKKQKETEQKPKEQIKREPCAMRLRQDAVVIGRSLARTLHGSEEKFGNLVEDAIFFFSANREDEARASALLHVTEERLIRRVIDGFESMYKSLSKREDKMVERIAGLNAIGAFEIALVELILKDRFVVSDKEKARYEELRSRAASRLKDRLERAGAEQIAELTEQNERLTRRIEELESQNKTYLDTCNSLKTDKQTFGKNLESEQEQVKSLTDTLNTKNRLIAWYKKRDEEVTTIQERNKGVLGKQKYEDAMKEFEKLYPKPEGGVI